MGIKEKKRSKKVSKGRKKKGDRNSRKRSARKLRRHEDSYSVSDDESLGSVSSSSYSSQDGVVKGRWSRSRARKDVKGRKKRARSSSCSSDSSADSMRVKKRRSSRKKVGLGRKKKDGKKYKRSSSLSSMGSDDSDYERHVGELKKKGTHRIYDKEEKSKRKRKGNRARSVSPSTESSASDKERKRKRYRLASCSSSSASSESEKEGKRKRYWFPGGSSLNRGSKSSDQHVQYEIEFQNKPIRKLNSIIVISSSVEPDQNSVSERLDNDLDMRNDARSTKVTAVEKGENIEEEKSAVESTSLVPGDEDLESILRHKALENLKRFRGGPKTSEKSEKVKMRVTGKKQLPYSENIADQENTGGSGMKHSLSSEIVPFQNESDKDGVPSVNLVSSSEKEEVLATPSVININTSIKNNVETKTGSTNCVQYSEDNMVMTPKADKLNPPSIIAGKNSNSGHGSVSRHNLIPQPGNSSSVKTESDTLLLIQEPLVACSLTGLKSSPQECINATSVPSKCSTDTSSNIRIDEVNPKNVGNIIKEESSIVNANVPDNPSSSLIDTMAGEQASSENKKENKEDSQSQFLVKTMTVTRGGELVQVSYKVYIPKKTPAANRRRLNR